MASQIDSKRQNYIVCITGNGKQFFRVLYHNDDDDDEMSEGDDDGDNINDINNMTNNYTL